MNTKCFILALLLKFCFCPAAPHILLIEPWFWDKPAGLGISNLYQAQIFNEHNYPFLTIFGKGSISERYFKELHLPYDVFAMNMNNEANYVPISKIKKEIMIACKNHEIDIVITPRGEDIPELKKLALQVPLKIIFVRHASKEQDAKFNFELIAGVDGFVGGNPDLVAHVTELNSTYNLGIKNITGITPFWDQKKCLHFSSDEKRSEYFKRRFNIILDEKPVVCTIANLIDPCKNHPLLFKAMQVLMHQKNKPFHAMIAGSGPLRESLEKLCKTLNIQDYVHFLGSINDIPALLYHSDIHILPSYYESFPLANLEAACMKKPIIVTAGTGASHFIQDGITGLLFKNNNVEDLVQKIEYLLDFPEQRMVLGENAYKHVIKKYSNEALFEQWTSFLSRVMDKA